MKNKMLAVFMMAMLIAAPQAWAKSNFDQTVKKAGNVALIGVSTVIAIPVVVAGAAVLLPVMLLASMSGGMNH